jgi:hypothetical protein
VPLRSAATAAGTFAADIIRSSAFFIQPPWQKIALSPAFFTQVLVTNWA